MAEDPEKELPINPINWSLNGKQASLSEGPKFGMSGAAGRDVRECGRKVLGATRHDGLAHAAKLTRNLRRCMRDKGEFEGLRLEIDARG